jgi:hypothetical protein
MEAGRDKRNPSYMHMSYNKFFLMELEVKRERVHAICFLPPHHGGFC